MKKQLIRVGASAALFAFVVGSMYAKDRLFPAESAMAAEYKARLAPIAKHLDDVARGGELLNANAVNDTLADLAAQYNTMPADQRIAMRPCLAALLHVEAGIEQVTAGQDWRSRDKYNTATDACR